MNKCKFQSNLVKFEYETIESIDFIDYKVPNGKGKILELINIVKPLFETIDIKECEIAIEFIKYSIKFTENNYNNYLEDTTFLFGKWYQDIICHPMILNVLNATEQFDTIILYCEENDKRIYKLIKQIFPIELKLENIRLKINKKDIFQFMSNVKSGIAYYSVLIKKCDDVFALIEEIIGLLENDIDNYFKNDILLLGKLENQVVKKIPDINLIDQIKKILRHFPKETHKQKLHNPRLYNLIVILGQNKPWRKLKTF